jgi:hypothetical protein
MALNTQRLSDAIRDSLISTFQWPQFDQTELEKFCDALAASVVNEVTGNAEIDAAIADPTISTQNGSSQITDPSVNGGII